MAHHMADRVEGLLFDAINTALEPVGSRQELLARIVREETHIDLAPDELWRIQQEIRGQIPRSGQDMEDYWPRINVHLVERIGYRNGDPTVVAKRIHDRCIGDATLYAVRDDMRELIAWASRRVRIIAIASNQRQQTLIGLLQAHGIAECFNRVFTSERLGHSKPSRRFFQGIRRSLRLKRLSQLALVGNSLENDAPAARLGIRTMIFDRSGSLSDLQASLPAGVRAAREIGEIRQWATEICAIGPDGDAHQDGDVPPVAAGSSGDT